MSFVDSFFSFQVELTAPEKDIYQKLKLKTPRHPEEPLPHLYARILAWLHSYREGLEFSRGYYAPDEPCLWRKDATARLLSWIEVGTPPSKKLKMPLRQSPMPEIRIYFHQHSQIEEFCLALRGSKSNWIEGIRFFLIPENLLTDLLPLSKSSSRWTATIVDDSLFLNIDGFEIQSQIEELDMWQRYQSSINN